MIYLKLKKGLVEFKTIQVSIDCIWVSVTEIAPCIFLLLFFR